MKFVHVDLGDADEEEIQRSVNRAFSVIASVMELMEITHKNGLGAVPLQVLGEAINEIVGMKSKEVEEALDQAYKNGKEKNLDFFSNVNGKEKLPDNVVPFPMSKTVH